MKSGSRAVFALSVLIAGPGRDACRIAASEQHRKIVFEFAALFGVDASVTGRKLIGQDRQRLSPRVYELRPGRHAEPAFGRPDTCDPEIPVNVVDLGLIYNVAVADDGVVDIDMTLTSMGCPVQDMIQADAELAAMKVEGVRRVNVEFVWSPPWSMDKMTEDGKKQMRMFGFNV